MRYFIVPDMLRYGSVDWLRERQRANKSPEMLPCSARGAHEVAVLVSRVDEQQSTGPGLAHGADDRHRCG